MILCECFSSKFFYIIHMQGWWSLLRWTANVSSFFLSLSVELDAYTKNVLTAVLNRFPSE